jgi:hypothetical protein
MLGGHGTGSVYFTKPMSESELPGEKAYEVSKAFTIGMHSYLRVRARFWAIHTWDGGETGYVMVDGVKWWESEMEDSTWVASQVSYDGEEYGARFYDVEVVRPHIKRKDVTITFGSTIDQGGRDEMWAFSGLTVDVDASNLLRQAKFLYTQATDEANLAESTAHDLKQKAVAAKQAYLAAGALASTRQDEKSVAVAEYEERLSEENMADGIYKAAVSNVTDHEGRLSTATQDVENIKTPWRDSANTNMHNAIVAHNRSILEVKYRYGVKVEADLIAAAEAEAISRSGVSLDLSTKDAQNTTLEEEKAAAHFDEATKDKAAAIAAKEAADREVVAAKEAVAEAQREREGSAERKENMQTNRDKKVALAKQKQLERDAAVDLLQKSRDSLGVAQREESLRQSPQRKARIHSAQHKSVSSSLQLAEDRDLASSADEHAKQEASSIPAAKHNAAAAEQIEAGAAATLIAAKTNLATKKDILAGRKNVLNASSTNFSSAVAEENEADSELSTASATERKEKAHQAAQVQNQTELWTRSKTAAEAQVKAANVSSSLAHNADVVARDDKLAWENSSAVAKAAWESEQKSVNKVNNVDDILAAARDENTKDLEELTLSRAAAATASQTVTNAEGTLEERKMQQTLALEEVQRRVQARRNTSDALQAMKESERDAATKMEDAQSQLEEAANKTKEASLQYSVKLVRWASSREAQSIAEDELAAAGNALNRSTEVEADGEGKVKIEQEALANATKKEEDAELGVERSNKTVQENRTQLLTVTKEEEHRGAVERNATEVEQNAAAEQRGATGAVQTAWQNATASKMVLEAAQAASGAAKVFLNESQEQYSAAMAALKKRVNITSTTNASVMTWADRVAEARASVAIEEEALKRLKEKELTSAVRHNASLRQRSAMGIALQEQSEALKSAAQSEVDAGIATQEENETVTVQASNVQAALLTEKEAMDVLAEKKSTEEGVKNTIKQLEVRCATLNETLKERQGSLQAALTAYDEAKMTLENKALAFSSAKQAHLDAQERSIIAAAQAKVAQLRTNVTKKVAMLEKSAAKSKNATDARLTQLQHEQKARTASQLANVSSALASKTSELEREPEYQQKQVAAAKKKAEVNGARYSKGEATIAKESRAVAKQLEKNSTIHATATVERAQAAAARKKKLAHLACANSTDQIACLLGAAKDAATPLSTEQHLGDTIDLDDAIQESAVNMIQIQDEKEPTVDEAASTLKLATDEMAIARKNVTEMKQLSEMRSDALQNTTIMRDDLLLKIDETASELKLAEVQRENAAGSQSADKASRQAAQVTFQAAESRLNTFASSWVQAQRNLSASNESMTHARGGVTSATEDEELAQTNYKAAIANVSGGETKLQEAIKKLDAQQEGLRETKLLLAEATAEEKERKDVVKANAQKVATAADDLKRKLRDEALAASMASNAALRLSKGEQADNETKLALARSLLLLKNATEAKLAAINVTALQRVANKAAAHALVLAVEHLAQEHATTGQMRDVLKNAKETLARLQQTVADKRAAYTSFFQGDYASAVAKAAEEKQEADAAKISLASRQNIQRSKSKLYKAAVGNWTSETWVVGNGTLALAVAVNMLNNATRHYNASILNVDSAEKALQLTKRENDTAHTDMGSSVNVAAQSAQMVDKREQELETAQYREKDAKSVLSGANAVRDAAAHRSEVSTKIAAKKRSNATEHSQLESLRREENTTEFKEISEVKSVAEQVRVTPAEEEKAHRETVVKQMKQKRSHANVEMREDIADVNTASNVVNVASDVERAADENATATHKNAVRLREWQVEESEDAVRAKENAKEANMTATADADALKSAKDTMEGLQEAHRVAVTAHTKAVQTFMDLVKKRILAEEHASDVFEHQAAVARRAEGLFENATMIDARVPPEVAAATKQMGKAEVAAAVADGRMKNAVAEWETAQTARRAAAQALQEVQRLHSHLKDNVHSSIAKQKQDADAAAATTLENLNAASADEDSKREARLTKQEIKQKATTAWEMAVQLEDSSAVELKQAEKDKSIKDAIWSEKKAKLEAAAIKKELAHKAWEAAESDKKAKLPPVATTEGAANIAKDEAAVAQTKADELKVWVGSLMGTDEEKDNTNELEEREEVLLQLDNDAGYESIVELDDRS